MENLELNSKGLLTLELRSRSVNNWNEFLSYIRNLPYGRTSNRTDLKTVIKENKGTCSSKHALVKKIADENDIKGVELIMCIYKMNSMNTPGIGDEIVNNNLTYIPEAHCYIKIKNEKIDLTSPDSDLSRINSDVLNEVSIKPFQVVEYKVNYHKNFIKDWIAENSLSFTFDKIWSIREKCIKNLEYNK